MGALYEDVEKFFGDIFALLGRFVGRHPAVFVIVSLLVSVLLGLGLLNMHSENDVERLYTPMGSAAARSRAHLQELFPDMTAKSYYAHQLVHHGTFGELLLSSRHGDNVLSTTHLAEVQALYDHLQAVTLGGSTRGLQYADVCALRSGQCVVSGDVVLNHTHGGCVNVSQVYHSIEDATGYGVDLRDVLGGMEPVRATENGKEGVHMDCVTAKVMRLRFNLRHDTEQQRQLGLLWERKFLEVLSSYKSKSLDVSYAVSESLDIELANHLGKDVKFFSLTIISMVLYTLFVSSGGDWVSTRMLLAQAGIVAALLAILASFGLLSMCGIVFVDMCGVMPFLILGVGVDDMFILMSGWRQTDINHSIEERLGHTFKSSAISVTITSLTNLLAFCIGATSPFLSVRNFCIYAGVAVMFCYLNQLTFFAGCMALHARRVQASRHCVTCKPTKSREELEAAHAPTKEILFCHGERPTRAGEDDSICDKIPSTVFPRLLLKWPVKIAVFVLFIIYLGISIWGASRMKIGLKIESVVPDSSYFSKYSKVERTFFLHNGPPIMFVITEPVPYERGEMRDKIRALLDQSRRSLYIHSDFCVSWLEAYHEYSASSPPENRPEFTEDVRENFLAAHPEYINDIKFSESGDEIVTSRFYIRSDHLNSSTEEGDMMVRMREIAANFSPPITVYSPEFIHYEHYVSILKNTLLSVGVAFIGMIFIALMFIPHPISIICVTFAMVTIVLGMFGFMHFWDLELSAITNVQIILSVGFCVDFTVHISHAFMTATGKNRNERVISALEKVGIPILNGAISSVLGVLILAFADSYVFRSFFKTMLLVISLGVGHSLLLLPVVLSFIGPKRTSKPRVFIPISNNWSNDGLAGLFGLGKVQTQPEDQGESESCLPPSPSSGPGGSGGGGDLELKAIESSQENGSRTMESAPAVAAVQSTLAGSNRHQPVPNHHHHQQQHKSTLLDTALSKEIPPQNSILSPRVEDRAHGTAQDIHSSGGSQHETVSVDSLESPNTCNSTLSDGEIY